MNLGPETQIFLSVSARPGKFGSSVYNSLFPKYGINAVYLPRRAPNDPRELISAMRTFDIRGCSVSMPLKSKVIPFLDSVDSEAEQVQSVNTLVHQNGKISGYNTDFYGIQECLHQLSRIDSTLIYGSGALIGSFVGALAKKNCKEIYFFARRRDGIKPLIEFWKNRFPGVLMKEFVGHGKFDLFVNATPADLKNSKDLQLGFECAESVFDVVVSPKPTSLVQSALDQKRKTISGVEMCRNQIRRQFSYYTGHIPSLEEIDLALNGFFSTKD